MMKLNGANILHLASHTDCLFVQDLQTGSISTVYTVGSGKAWKARPTRHTCMRGEHNSQALPWSKWRISRIWVCRATLNFEHQPALFRATYSFQEKTLMPSCWLSYWKIALHEFTVT